MRRTATQTVLILTERIPMLLRRKSRRSRSLSRFLSKNILKDFKPSIIVKIKGSGKLIIVFSDWFLIHPTVLPSSSQRRR